MRFFSALNVLKYTVSITLMITDSIVTWPDDTTGT